MLWRLLLVAGLLFGVCAIAQSQEDSVVGGGVSGVFKATGGGGGYQGPGDLVTFAAWYGVRAYSAATAGNPAINLCNVADATCSDVSTNASTGNLTFGGTIGGQSCSNVIVSGTYTTATGAVSLVLTSSVTGLATGQGIAAVGITGNGTGVASLDGVFTTTVGSTGTTLNYTAPTGAGTVTLITGGTIWSCTAKKIYDQTAGTGGPGGNNCTSASCDLSGNSPVRYVLIGSCLNSFPCLQGQGSGVVSSSSTAINSIVAQPYAVSAVAVRTGATLGGNVIFITATASNAETYFGVSSTTIGGYAGTAQTVTGATEGAWHSIQNSFNGASGNIYVDGTAATKSMGSGAPSGVLRLGGAAAANTNGEIVEVGIAPVTFVGANAKAMCTNQSTYWNLSLTCN